MAVIWIIRSCNHIYNYEYISYHEFKYYREKKIEEIKVSDEEVLDDEATESQSSIYVRCGLVIESGSGKEI